MLPKEAIYEFKEIYKQKFNLDLEFEEAKSLAEKFIDLYDIATKTKNKYNDLSNSNRN